MMWRCTACGRSCAYSDLLPGGWCPKCGGSCEIPDLVEHRSPRSVLGCGLVTMLSIAFWYWLVCAAIAGNEHTLEEIDKANSLPSASGRISRKRESSSLTGPSDTHSDGAGPFLGAGEPRHSVYEITSRSGPRARNESRPAHEWVFSVYATRYHGRAAANGEPYDHLALTCASNAHELGARLLVRAGGSSVIVKVTDRLDRALGKTRIDLSGAAMAALNPGYDLTDATAGLLRGTAECIQE